MQADNFLDEQINNMDNNMGTNIKIRTLDGEFQVKINVENKVEELKRKIEDISKVPTNRQRLIFRGKLLKDADALSFYKISDLDVIHLVAKTTEQRNEEESEMNNESNNTTRRSDNSMLNLMNRMFRMDNNEGGNETNNSIGGNNRASFIPAIVGRRSRRNAMREENINFNVFECKEAIVQNFEYLNNLKECSKIDNSFNKKEKKNDEIYKSNMNNFNNFAINNEDSFDNLSRNNSIKSELFNTESSNLSNKFELFDFTRVKLKKGQWVDVKDTIDQWLEAQVIDVKDDKVYIHYNGWGTRWDEWIDMKSDRIRPFRFHTRQTSFTNYQSPYPNIKPDANVNMTNNQTDSESLYDNFENIKSAFNMADSLMSEIHKRKTDNIFNTIDIDDIHKRQKEIYILSKNLAPILDRLGRSITDVGGFINFNLRNNKLEDLDKNVFDMKHLDPSLKTFEQADLQRFDEEQSANRNGRDMGANLISPVNPFDRNITNQIPIIDTPLTIHNSRPNQSQPALDIYVHTIITPLSNTNSQQTNTNSATNSNYRTISLGNSSEGGLNNPLDFVNLLTNSRHNLSNSNETVNQANTQRNTSREVNNINSNNNNNGNNSRNTLLGHKRENPDKASDESNRDKIELNGNAQNIPNDLNNNLPRDSSINNIQTINLNMSDEINNNSSSPCFDIIVEDLVESESLNDEEDADVDSDDEL